MSFARHYHGPKFHALLCDPPYHLTSGNAVYDLARTGSGNPRVRRSTAGGGFMGKKWDGGDIAFDPSTWAALAEHLHPGAFGMAFASSRGWHRLACAIEDAGLRIHPSIFGWAFGSGFPKATRIKDAPAFDGHRYGLQAMKPAVEPIIVFQVPYQGKPVESITETGAGALWIDGARVGTDWVQSSGNHGMNKRGAEMGYRPNDYDSTQPPSVHQGRWPANFVIDAEAARRLGEQGEARGVHSAGNAKQPGGWNSNGGWGFIGAGEYGGARKGDKGSCARFFFNVSSQLDEADPVLYCAKASRKERDAGLEDARNINPCVKPLDLTRWLATLLLPPAEYAPRRILIPFAGSGSECIGAHLAGWEEVVGIEREREYVEIAKARAEHWQPVQLELIA